MSDKSVIRTDAAPAPFQGAPYSQAIAAGGFVFVSGQLGLRAGDTIFGINGTATYTFDDVRNAIRNSNGKPLQLIVLHLKGHGGTYWKAVRGLIAMLPDLTRDRAEVARFRKLPDGALLSSDRLIVREDLMTPLARLGKGVYEGWLAAYWSLLRHTVLAE